MNAAPPIPGQLITFEGIDGAGKSTQIGHVRSWLHQQGIAVTATREPGGTPLAERLRTELLGTPMEPETEALLAFAARSDHLQRVIRPALARGEWVVCDRFSDSTAAYQGGGRALGTARVHQLAQWLHPDLHPLRTYVFDLDPTLAAQRLARRDPDGPPQDRFEQEQVCFFGRVRAAYQACVLAEPVRFLMLDAGSPPEVIRARIYQDLEQLLATSRRMARLPGA